MPRRWECGACRAAAHAGAALQGNYSVCVGAAALPRPWAPHFHKTVIPRSAATWESVFPMRECSAWRIRFPTPACGLVRNDKDFGKRCRWRTAGAAFFHKASPSARWSSSCGRAVFLIISYFFAAGTVFLSLVSRNAVMRAVSGTAKITPMLLEMPLMTSVAT